jgi:hypothetical protein
VQKLSSEAGSCSAGEEIPILLRNLNIQYRMGFQVFKAVTVKDTVLWDVASCSSSTHRRFGGKSAFTKPTQRDISEDGISHSLLY